MAWIRHGIAVTTVMALGGCGLSESRLNPLNWFASEETGETVVVGTEAQVVDPRPRVAVISDLTREVLPGGVILRVTALPPEQGWFDPQLVRENSTTPGVLVYSFRAIPPETPTRVSTVQSRELVAGTFLSDIELQGVREVQVLGATNGRTLRP